MSLNIVFKNTDKKPVCTCNVCGRQDKWSNRWRCVEFGIGIGYKGEDRYYFTCSKECRKKDDDEKLLIKYQKELHDKWWEAYGDYVDDFEKDFKGIMDKQYEKILNNG